MAEDQDKPLSPEDTPFGADVNDYLNPEEEETEGEETESPTVEIDPDKPNLKERYEEAKETAKKGKDAAKKLKKLGSSEAGEAAATTEAAEGAAAAGARAAASGAARAGATAAGEVAAEAGLAATGVGAPIALALVGIQAVDMFFADLKRRKILFYVTLFWLAMAILLFVMAIARFNDARHYGPDASGGTGVLTQEDSYAAAVAARQPGLVTAYSVETITTMIAKTEAILKNPPKGTNVGEAQRVLGEMKKLLPDLKTYSYASDPTKAAETTKKYQELTTQLQKALYPGREGAKNQVVALLGTKIRTQSGAACNPRRDIERLAISQNAYRLLANVAQQQSITVNCLVSGHRKYIGMPPSQGHPRCGDPATRRGKPSAHCLGLAMDLSPSSSLYNYLAQHKKDLNIRVLLDEGNHIHVEVKPDYEVSL